MIKRFTFFASLFFCSLAFAETASNWGASQVATVVESVANIDSNTSDYLYNMNEEIHSTFELLFSIWNTLGDRTQANNPGTIYQALKDISINTSKTDFNIVTGIYNAVSATTQSVFHVDRAIGELADIFTNKMSRQFWTYSNDKNIPFSTAAKTIQRINATNGQLYDATFDKRYLDLYGLLQRINDIFTMLPYINDALLYEITLDKIRNSSLSSISNDMHKVSVAFPSVTNDLHQVSAAFPAVTNSLKVATNHLAKIESNTIGLQVLTNSIPSEFFSDEHSRLNYLASTGVNSLSPFPNSREFDFSSLFPSSRRFHYSFDYDYDTDSIYSAPDYYGTLDGLSWAQLFQHSIYWPSLLNSLHFIRQDFKSFSSNATNSLKEIARNTFGLNLLTNSIPSQFLTDGNVTRFNTQNIYGNNSDSVLPQAMYIGVNQQVAPAFATRSGFRFTSATHNNEYYVSSLPDLKGNLDGFLWAYLYQYSVYWPSLLNHLYWMKYDFQDYNRNVTNAIVSVENSIKDFSHTTSNLLSTIDGHVDDLESSISNITNLISHIGTVLDDFYSSFTNIDFSASITNDLAGVYTNLFNITNFVSVTNDDTWVEQLEDYRSSHQDKDIFPKYQFWRSDDLLGEGAFEYDEEESQAASGKFLKDMGDFMRVNLALLSNINRSLMISVLTNKYGEAEDSTDDIESDIDEIDSQQDSLNEMFDSENSVKFYSSSDMQTMFTLPQMPRVNDELPSTITFSIPHFSADGASASEAHEVSISTEKIESALSMVRAFFKLLYIFALFFLFRWLFGWFMIFMRWLWSAINSIKF